MEIMLVYTGVLQENCYIVYNEIDKRGFVIDPGDEFEKIKKYVDSKNIDVQYVLVTHGHYDHVGAVAGFQKAGAKVYMSKADESKICSPNIQSYNNHGVEKFTIDTYVKDGDMLDLCGYKVKVVATPGHSVGGVCYILDDMIFCGDTLFRKSFGRYDFPDGDFKVLSASIEKLFALEGNYTLLCGHGETSELDFERKYNPIRNYL
ncbi:MAG: MBL fold metallo-hydrolase [Clostridia bacterium]